MKREIIRAEPPSTYLERWKAPTSAATRHGSDLCRFPRRPAAQVERHSKVRPTEAPMLVDEMLSLGLPSLMEPARPMPDETCSLTQHGAH